MEYAASAKWYQGKLQARSQRFQRHRPRQGEEDWQLAFQIVFGASERRLGLDGKVLSPSFPQCQGRVLLALQVQTTPGAHMPFSHMHSSNTNSKFLKMDRI
jgi:hypothetical protein